MNKLEYLFETSNGQWLKHVQRWRNKLTFNLQLEPKSKKSISTSQKITFQQQIHQQLSEKNRRAFLGPIAMEFDFYPTRDNPPHIHKLPKNYLDLLGTPLKESKIKRKNLLFQDDRQVQILVVNYHIEERNEESCISINTVGLSNIIEDLKLLDKIKRKSFYHDDESYTYEMEELHESLKRNPSIHMDLDNAIDNYHSTKELESLYTKEADKKGFDSLLNINLSQIQENIFAIDKINPLDLLNLYPSVTEQPYAPLPPQLHRLGNLIDSGRELVMSPVFSPSEIPSLPTQKGETKIFKEGIRNALSNFKKRYKYISPLLVNISLTILYIPPEHQEIDLDNLARYIIPIFNEEMEPIGKSYFGSEDIKGYTQNSITQYQVIRIPRKQDDPADGMVRLVINQKKPYSSILSDLDSIIFNWHEVVNDY